MKLATFLLFGALALGSCKKDKDTDPPVVPPNEEEVITTLRLHFRSSHDVEHKLFEFRDVDGDGGNQPVVETDTLSADSMYNVAIEVLNESGDPVVDITEEILEEGDAHQFFFLINGADVTVSYADVDVNGRPIGLSTTWTVGTAGQGSLLLTLRHGPDKNATGVTAGDITNAGGETDIEVTFPLVVE